MYQVIQTKGTDEPWWFFENWKRMIQHVTEVETLDEAVSTYHELSEIFAQQYAHHREKDGTLAYWNDDETEFCGPCDDDLQVYHGLLVMQGETLVSMEEGGSRG